MQFEWKGVFPAVTTQFHQDLSLDLDLTAKHLQVLLDSGVTGFVMLGSLGENVSLSRDEKRAVLKCALEVANGKIPVVSGVAEFSGHDAATFSKEVEQLGVNGLMVMPAMSFRPDKEEIKAHYLTVAKATGLPVMIYNNPISYHADVTPEILVELAEQPNLVAIKESCGDTRRITDIINTVGDRYALFGGVDDLILEATMLGAVGWVAGVGLAFPKENQYLWDLMMAGKWAEAVEIYRWFSPLLHLDIGTKFVQKIKLCLQEVGLGTEYVRLPRVPLTGAIREESLAIIREGIEKRPTIA